MFIGHLPAGYLLAKLLEPQGQMRIKRSKLWWAAALGGSVFPDLDVLYFYLVDNARTLHHHYFTHLPAFWLCVSLLGVWSSTTRIFLVAVVSHLVLDTIAGGVLWLWPLSYSNVVFVDVPATHSWWVWNFIFHWTFLLELALWVAAAYVWQANVNRRRVLS